MRIDLPACIRSKASLMRRAADVRDQIVDRRSCRPCTSRRSRHVGAAARAAERGAFPDAAGHELERPRRISCPAPATPMMTRHAPAAVAALERLAHQRRRCRRTRSCSRRRRRSARRGGATRSPPTSFGFTKCVMPNLRGQRLARRVDVDADDHVGAGHARALHDVEADAAEAEHDDVRAGLDLRGVDHRADAGRDAAADVADLVERRVLRGSSRARSPAAPCGSRTSSSPCSDGSCWPSSEKRLVPSGITPLPCVARIAVHRFVLRDRHDLHCAALGRVERDHVVARLQASSRRRRPRRRRPRPRGRGSPGTGLRDRRPSA